MVAQTSRTGAGVAVSRHGTLRYNTESQISVQAIRDAGCLLSHYELLLVIQLGELCLLLSVQALTTVA